MPGDTLYFFDCPITQAWCNQFLNLSAHQSYLVSDYASVGKTVITRSERIAWATSRLPDPERQWASCYLDTIDRLRETFILLPEHADFCFENLPATPKNILLRKLIADYFESELKHDAVAFVWELIGQLKTGIGSKFENVVLIRSLKPSLILEEFASALRYGSKSVSLVEAGELGGARAKPSDQKLITGSLTSRMMALAEEAANFRREKQGKIFIPFCGDEADRRTLELCLSSHGLRTKLVHPAQACAHPFQRFGRLPLQDRLELQKLFWQHAPYFEDWDGFWKRMHECGKVSPEQLGFLTSSVPNDTNDSGDSNDFDAIIGPFIVLPRIGNVAITAFISEEPFRFENNLYLTDDECHRLVRTGFPVPTFHDNRTRILTQANFAEVVYGPPEFETFWKGTVQEAIITPAKRAKAVEPRFALPPTALSATGLENYARCPSAYFFAQRMRLKDPIRWDDSFHALALGQSLHLTLEKFFKSARSDFECLPDLFKETVQSEFPGLCESDPFLIRLMVAFAALSEQIPRLEESLQRLFGSAKPIEFEKPFDQMIDGIRVRGKIDRIDETPRGQILLDYKSGTVSFSPNQIKNGEHFQALLYVLCEQARGILFYDLKKGEIRRGLVQKGVLDESGKSALTRGHALDEEQWKNLIAVGKGHLLRIARAAENGEFEASPSRERCEYCAYPTHCRSFYADL